MEINVSEQDNFSVVELSGDVDLSCSPEARKQILQVIEAGKNLIVHLGNVTYIDSSGIASLVEGYQTAKKKQSDFALVSASEAVMSVIKLARLDKVFPMFESVEAYNESQST